MSEKAMQGVVCGGKKEKTDNGKEGGDYKKKIFFFCQDPFFEKMI